MIKYLLCSSIIISTIAISMDDHKHALIHAITENNIPKAEALLKMGAPADCLVKHCRHILVKAKTVAAAQLLLEHGAQIIGTWPCWLFHDFMKEKYEPELIPLFIAHGADPRARQGNDRNNTVLHSLIICHCPLLKMKQPEPLLKKATYLLDAAPDLLRIANAEDLTPWQIAQKRQEIITLWRNNKNLEDEWAEYDKYLTVYDALLSLFAQYEQALLKRSN